MGTGKILTFFCSNREHSLMQSVLKVWGTLCTWSVVLSEWTWPCGFYIDAEW